MVHVCATESRFTTPTLVRNADDCLSPMMNASSDPRESVNETASKFCETDPEEPGCGVQMREKPSSEALLSRLFAKSTPSTKMPPRPGLLRVVPTKSLIAAVVFAGMLKYCSGEFVLFCPSASQPMPTRCAWLR